MENQSSVDKQLLDLLPAWPSRSSRFLHLGYRKERFPNSSHGLTSRRTEGFRNLNLQPLRSSETVRQALPQRSRIDMPKTKRANLLRSLWASSMHSGHPSYVTERRLSE